MHNTPEHFAQKSWFKTINMGKMVHIMELYSNYYLNFKEISYMC